jgi:dTDP-4-amino-4,6-dideoxygalactose transaminase
MERQGVPFCRPVIAPEAGAAVERVLRSGWVTTGPECAAFEEEFADHLGVQHAVSVSSCTAAIELAFRAMRLPRGSRVLVPSITFCGAVEALVHAGLQPVLVDCEPGTAEVSPRTCADAARAVGGVQAMLALHYAGAPAPVRELARAAGVGLEHVVEDAAHALGTQVDGRAVGGLSRATCFSFYATKNLPIGEGGMLTTDDEELAARVRVLRMHGMTSDAWRRYLPGGSWRYSVQEAGLKANLSDVQAAIGRVQLRHLKAWQQRRHEIAEQYAAGLQHLPGLELPREPGGADTHAWHLYVVRVTDAFGATRDRLVEELAGQGIGTSVHFIPLHHMPRFRDVCRMPAAGLPGADAVSAELLSLPMHPGLTADEVDRVVEALVASKPRNRYQEVSR